MRILLYKDIFYLYFKYSTDNHIKTEKERCIHDIFNNISNIQSGVKLILNRNLEKLIKEELGDFPFYKEFITYILSNGCIENVESGNSNNDYDEEFIQINTNFNSPKLLLCLEKNKLDQLPNLAIYSECKKPNNHWLSFMLAQKSNLTLHYFDFKSNIEIKKLFQFIYYLSESRNFVILDRNFNLKGDCLTELKKIKKRIFYYTYSKSDLERYEKLKDANTFFSGGVKLYTTRNRDDIHERRIIFDGFIVSTDEDFWNITADRTTWRIDFAFSKEIANSILEKRKLFSEYINRS